MSSSFPASDAVGTVRTLRPEVRPTRAESSLSAATGHLVFTASIHARRPGRTLLLDNVLLSTLLTLQALHELLSVNSICCAAFCNHATRRALSADA